MSSTRSNFLLLEFSSNMIPSSDSSNHMISNDDSEGIEVLIICILFNVYKVVGSLYEM